MKRKAKIINIDPKTDEETHNDVENNSLRKMAKNKENDGRFVEAAKLYEKLLKIQPLNEYGYNRLMMIYRREKNYKNELRVIETGIKIFKNHYKPIAKGKGKKIMALSRQLNILVGLTDRKGNALFDAEPVAKWKKRKEIVLKKLKAGKK